MAEALPPKEENVAPVVASASETTELIAFTGKYPAKNPVVT